MKKIIVFLFVVCLASSAWAIPFRSGLYIGIKGGGVYSKIDTPWVEHPSQTSKKDTTFAMAVAAGFRIRHFRIEAEYLMMNKQKADGGYEQETETFMGQLYFDLPFKSPIRPFVNIGMGAYTTSFKRKGEWSDKARSSIWGGGGGLTWAISTATNLDVGYRYLDIGRFKTRDGSVKQDNHVGYIGWRHVF